MTFYEHLSFAYEYVMETVNERGYSSTSTVEREIVRDEKADLLRVLHEDRH